MSISYKVDSRLIHIKSPIALSVVLQQGWPIKFCQIGTRWMGWSNSVHDRLGSGELLLRHWYLDCPDAQQKFYPTHRIQKSRVKIKNQFGYFLSEGYGRSQNSQNSFEEIRVSEGTWARQNLKPLFSLKLSSYQLRVGEYFQSFYIKIFGYF